MLLDETEGGLLVIKFIGNTYLNYKPHEINHDMKKALENCIKNLSIHKYLQADMSLSNFIWNTNKKKAFVINPLEVFKADNIFIQQNKCMVRAKSIQQDLYKEMMTRLFRNHSRELGRDFLLRYAGFNNA